MTLAFREFIRTEKVCEFKDEMITAENFLGET
jgi:hypothetical protein